jgi:hypothetical protein
MDARETDQRMIKRWHAFGDYALLRRALIGWRLVQRTQDGSEYRRIEQKPPTELSPWGLAWRHARS